MQRQRIMGAHTHVLLFAAILAGSAGCAAESVQTAPRPSATSTASIVSASPESALPNSVPSTADASDSGVDDALGPDAWRGGLASADGLELLLVVTGGPGNMDADPCAIDYEPSVEESAAQVRVIVEGRRSAKYDPSTTVCPDTQVERQIVVELVEPLSSRLGEGRRRSLLDVGRDVHRPDAR